MRHSLLLIVPLLLSLTACEWLRGVEGSGTRKEEKREGKNFNALRVSGAYDLTVTLGEDESLTLSGDDNLLPLIETSVEGGVLIVKNRKSISPKLPLRLTISAKALRELKVSGSLRGSVTGLDTDVFGLVASGSCRLTLAGRADALTMSVSGSGSLDAAGLRAKVATVKISGSGDADVEVSESLSVKISGSGKVRYGGEPKNVDRDISGSGSVVPR
jgi:hypothetical protein